VDVTNGFFCQGTHWTNPLSSTGFPNLKTSQKNSKKLVDREYWPIDNDDMLSRIYEYAGAQPQHELKKSAAMCCFLFGLNND
jgi:hypothetical protein